MLLDWIHVSAEKHRPRPTDDAFDAYMNHLAHYITLACFVSKRGVLYKALCDFEVGLMLGGARTLEGHPYRFVRGENPVYTAEAFWAVLVAGDTFGIPLYVLSTTIYKMYKKP